MRESIENGIFLLLIALAAAFAQGCASPQINIAQDLHSSAIKAQTTVSDQIMPALRNGGSDAQKIYSAATVQIFLCKQKTIEVLKNYALGKDDEAQRLYDDAMAICTWKPIVPPPVAMEPPKPMVQP